jgi:hypothetical protein
VKLVRDVVVDDTESFGGLPTLGNGQPITFASFLISIRVAPSRERNEQLIFGDEESFFLRHEHQSTTQLDLQSGNEGEMAC